MARKKSIDDIRKQFDRLWERAVESSDAYQRVKRHYPNSSDSWFRIADNELRSGTTLSSRDKRINEQINMASSVAGRYVRNIENKKGVAGDIIAAWGSTERRNKYNKIKQKRYAQSTYMGMSNG